MSGKELAASRGVNNQLEHALKITLVTVIPAQAGIPKTLPAGCRSL